MRRELDEEQLETHNDAVLPDFNVVPNGSSLNDAPSTDMYMVAYLHGIIVEFSSERLIRRSAPIVSLRSPSRQQPHRANAPDNAPLPYQTIPA